MTELKINYFFYDIDNFILPEVFNNIDFPWEVFKNTKSLLSNISNQKQSQIQSKLSQNVQIDGWVLIGKNTVIGANVVIEGPVIIGNNCTIRSGALIRSGSIISDNCVIGHGSEIKNSLIFEGTKIASLTFVGDSIIGKSARIGSGTIITNRRFDQKKIGLKFEDKFYEFDTDFFGCVLGDYCRIGANCTTLPGTFIGPYTWILPLTRVGRFVPKQKIVGSEQELIMKENRIIKLKD